MEQEYIVEEILDVRKGTKITKGRRWASWEYLVKWKDYPHSDNSWQPVKLMGKCEDAIRIFNDKRRADQYLAGQLKWTSGDVITGVIRVDDVRHDELDTSVRHLLVATEAGQQRRLTLNDTGRRSIIAALTTGLCDADAASDSATRTPSRAGKCSKKRKKHQKAASRKKRDGRRPSSRRPKIDRPTEDRPKTED